MVRPAAVLMFGLAVILPYTAAVMADSPDALRGDNRGDRIIGKPWAMRITVFARHGLVIGY